MNQDTAQATNIRPHPALQQDNTIRHQRWEISNVLQTTLNIEQLLELFSNTIQEITSHNGYTYTNENKGLDLSGGSTAHHSCSFRLIVENEDLGELKLMRRQRFTDIEISRVETILCCLVYPLRNAFLYLQALSSAHTDPLTNVNNRVAMDDCINHECQLAIRQDTPLSVMLLDIDYFKSINDNYGHACGDKVLQSVASCIKSTVRACDMIFRYGGEEFVVILSNTGPNGARLLAERVRHAIESTFIDWNSDTLSVTASLGVASLKQDIAADVLLQNADKAMYKAKSNGRNLVFSSLD